MVPSGGKLDPNVGNAPMLPAWKQDGQPLTGEDGPIRLVAPRDTLGKPILGLIRPIGLNGMQRKFDSAAEVSLIERRLGQPIPPTVPEDARPLA